MPRVESSSRPRLRGEEVEDLFRRFAPGLRRFLRGVLRDRDQAEDALQQTFVTATEKAQMAEPDHLKGWLYKVAFRHALATRRRAEVEQRVLADPSVGPSASLATDPAQDAIDQEKLAWLRGELAALPAPQREVMRLRLRESLTFAEIARRLDCPLGTVLTRARLAMERLRGKTT